MNTPEERLAAIRQAIIHDPANAWARERGYEPVYTAAPEARLLIVGQAPGRKAQESRLPWNDPSGDNLRRWLGVDRETFYDASKVALVPMDFYYPGKGKSGDLPPRKGFAEQWHPLIRAELPNIRLILPIGAYAHAYYLGRRRKESLTETVRAYLEYLPEFLPLVHPSPLTFRWRAQNPWFEEEVVPVLRERVERILAFS